MVSRDEATATAATPARQPITPSDGVRALANRFDSYATNGEAALPRAPINARDAEKIRANITKLRIAVAGMRTVAAKGDEHLNLALLGSFTSSRLRRAAGSLHKAAAASLAVTVSETAPMAVAAFIPHAASGGAFEREAQQIGRIISSVAQSSGSSSNVLVMRQAAPEIIQQVEQNAGVIDQLIDVSAVGLGVGVAVNDTVAIGALAAFLGSPVVVVAAVAVVALLAVAAVWYFWEQDLSEETRRLRDVPPQTGYPAPAGGVTRPAPAPPPVAERRAGAVFAELDNALAAMYIRAAQGQDQLLEMQPGWSRAKKEQYKNCRDLHDAYDVTKGDIGKAAGAIKKVRGNLDSLTPDEKLQFCAKIHELLGLIERLLNQRRNYDQLDCDDFPWRQDGKTAKERRERHRDEMDHLKEQDKNLREELRELQNPPPGRTKAC